MKKTIIALMAMGSVAFGLTATSVDKSIILDGTQATDSRLDMKYSTNADQTITTTVDSVTIYGTDGYGLTTANASLTFNIQNTLTATNAIKFPSAASSAVYINTTITETELSTLNTNDIVSRWVIETDNFQNISLDRITFTLNGLTGLSDGGFVFNYNDAYYSSSDVTWSGQYVTLKSDATSINLADGTLYTTLKITGVEDAAVKGIGFVATAAVPEPTTATLSLLALAGLAARRRRR